MQVTFGYNTIVLGRIEYQEIPLISVPVLIGIGIGGGIVLIILISVFIAYLQKRREANQLRATVNVEDGEDIVSNLNHTSHVW